VGNPSGALARRYRPGRGGIEDVGYLMAATALLDVEPMTINARTPRRV
jgi:hypothetical protein